MVPRAGADRAAGARPRAAPDRSSPRPPAGARRPWSATGWPSARRTRPAWVALDLADNDPARFWRYVAEALRRAGRRGWTSRPSARCRARTRPSRPGSRRCSTRSPTRREPTVLALDDYHLIADAAIHESVAFLVPRPARTACALVMTTRSDPPIGLARLRARGDLAELRARRPALHERRGRRALLGDAIGRRPAGRRGGAPAPAHRGLGRRASTWRGCRCAAATTRRAFIADFAGDDRLVVDYLAAEVLEGQPPRAARLPAAHVDPRPPQRARSATPSPAPSGSAARAGRARALEPVPRAPRQPPRVVPLPPPLRRAAAARAQR